MVINVLDRLSGLQAYNKAIVALIVGLVVVVAKQLELPISEGFEEALGIVVLGFFVWLVPNKK